MLQFFFVAVAYFTGGHSLFDHQQVIGHASHIGSGVGFKSTIDTTCQSKGQQFSGRGQFNGAVVFCGAVALQQMKNEK